MRTQAEIKQRIADLESSDVFGFQRTDLVEFLDFDHAKSFLKGGVTEADWKPKTPDRATLASEILEYLPFAWTKANDRRGLSAMRSLEHMKAWLWLYDQDVFEAFEARLADYDCYGKHQLAAISEYFGFPWRDYDDGQWVNDEDGPHVGVNEDFSWLPARDQPEA